MKKETVKLVPHPETLKKYKKIIILFFLILGILPIIVSYSLLFYKGYFDIIGFIIIIGWYIVYAVGTFKGIDILIKGYRVLYFNPKILIIDLIFLTILITPLFFFFLGFSAPFFLELPIIMRVGIIGIFLLLLLFYVFSCIFMTNTLNFLSIYAKILYLFDSFSGKTSSSFSYIGSSLSKIGTGIKFGLAKGAISLPGYITKSSMYLKLVEISLVFAVPLIIFEKLSIKEAFKTSSKMSLKQIPEIEFISGGPSLIAVYICLALVFFGSFLVPGLFIENFMSSPEFSFTFSNYLIIITIFLSYLVPAVIITLYYSSVASSTQEMSILLLYLKTKGYPVNIKEIQRFKASKS